METGVCRMSDLFLLSGFEDLSPEVRDPLRQTIRIKYTCFDASSNFVVFGATSGSLYLFSRNPCKFLHLIPNKHGNVEILSISPNEKYIAFATSKGIICVYVVNLSPNLAPQVIVSNTGDATAVTCLHWSAEHRQFYFGTKSGEVHLVTLTFFMGRSLLSISIHPILFLDAPIVQIADFESLLLVSNYTKCILCNTEYEEFKQIGNRPRDGDYGACFIISPNENLFASRIYCARPGSRLWEVDLEGNVIQTHQFKESLAIPPTKIIRKTKIEAIQTQCYDEDEGNDVEYPPQNLQFAKLQPIFSEFLLTHTETGLYIFDPRTSSVVLWCNEFERIVDCTIVGNSILVFTNSGGLFTLQLNTLQFHAMELVQRNRLLECAQFLKTNLKYFAEKAKEQYDLHVLNEIKAYLIENSEYEMLNDLSVIFDSINQNENEIMTTAKRTGTKSKRLNNGIYMLENSFCENLKMNRSSDKQFKDALLTVTGKFGKNIIKYKFNIFAEDQKNLVNDLIPNERNNPFKEINEQFENDEDIVCNRTRDFRKSQKTIAAITNAGPVLSNEQKTIHNLFMIFKSSKISNVNFLDRYSLVFDNYDSREIIDLLEKLKHVMIENGDSADEAVQNCYEMYFNYLKPEILWEIDDISRDYIINGFVVVNTDESILRCHNCEFPVEFPSICQFHKLGEILVKFLWSRNEQKRCLDILKSVPSIVDVICRFYIQENQIDKVIAIVLNYGDVNLLHDAGKSFDRSAWIRCFEKFVALQIGRLNCLNCDSEVQDDTDQISTHRFFDWNCFLNVALQYNKSIDILNLIIKYSKFIPNNAIDRSIFVKCLLK